MKITFLGTGANGGLPQVDCDCKYCRAALKKKNKQRLRSSLLVETKRSRILLDCGPDFRQQLSGVGLKIRDLDLIVITHFHFDHANGLIELSGGKPCKVPVLVSERVRRLWKRFPNQEIEYMVKSGFVKLVSEDNAKKCGVKLVDVPHDPGFPTVAVIVSDSSGKVWYSPDVSEITEKMIKEIAMIDVVVFDGTFLNENTYPASKFNHLTIEKSVDILKREVIYTHVNHSENVKEIENFLRAKRCLLARDGMMVTLK
jgi:phosphoribosyl 1,2-cyclic phosphate phosphodiesterase